ncbi:MAG: phosphoribosylglycinamide formyltransferase [Flavobacteriaceae bacterium]|nr:phosphoribosylglycinamide formyltransferase [Flavobacteriaceae bacterium]
MKRIVIFASGSGTNAENLINYFKESTIATVVRVLSNNEHAKVLERAKNLNVNTLVFNKEDFVTEDTVLDLLKKEADFIILAGFLWRIPQKIVNAFENKIVNIHPALLPKYGGKGMYGMNVHNAVVAHKEKKSGITIHYVNEHYDEGAIIFQKSVKLDADDSPDMVASKIHDLEYEYFPKVVEDVIEKLALIDG